MSSSKEETNAISVPDCKRKEKTRRERASPLLTAAQAKKTATNDLVRKLWKLAGWPG